MKYGLRIVTALIVVELASMIIACSMRTAGVTSETTNGATVSGLVAGPAGTPYRATLVQLWQAGSCDGCSTSTAMRSTMTADNGRYHFDSIPAGLYVVLSRPASDSALAKTISISAADKAVYVADSTVRATTINSGTAVLTGATGSVKVSVMGTDISTLSDATGRYTIGALPQADLLLRYAPQTSPYPALIVPSAVAFASDTLLLDTVPAALIENFDDGGPFDLLYPFTGFGRWYVRAAGGITVTPAGALADPSAAISDSGAWHNKSFSVAASFTAPADSDSLFIAGLEIGSGLTGETDRRWFDLSGMQALTFMAKGSGTLHVAFLSKLIQDHYTGSSQFESVITLTPAWQQFRIPASSLAPPAGSAAANDGRTWAEADTAIAEITFFSLTDVSLSLDDITIAGVSPLQLMAGQH